tara:strand:+ start:5778 stop:6326 length:549 start_codon:yes stop_codon:yes gene_type:complete
MEQLLNRYRHLRPIEEVEAIITSVLSLNLKASAWCVIVFGGMTLGALSSFVGNWVYDSPQAYFALIGLIFADHLSGMYLAYRHGRFETRKATRIFWTVCSHTALLVFGLNLAKGSNALSYLDELFFVPLCLVNIVSLVKNLSLLGWIKSEFAEWLYRRVDVYKNEFVKKEDSDISNTDANDK